MRSYRVAKRSFVWRVTRGSAMAVHQCSSACTTTIVKQQAVTCEAVTRWMSIHSKFVVELLAFLRTTHHPSARTTGLIWQSALHRGIQRTTRGSDTCGPVLPPQRTAAAGGGRIGSAAPPPQPSSSSSSSAAASRAEVVGCAPLLQLQIACFCCCCNNS